MNHKPMTKANRDHQQHVLGALAAGTALHLDFANIHILATLPPAMTASVYLPTHRFGPDRQQDHTRAKNLLHEARKLLTEIAGESRSTTILAPATAVIENPDFWAHPRDGLAMFCRESPCDQISRFGSFGSYR